MKRHPLHLNRTASSADHHRSTLLPLDEGNARVIALNLRNDLGGDGIEKMASVALIATLNL
jgi:hypothetical protein